MTYVSLTFVVDKDSCICSLFSTSRSIAIHIHLFAFLNLSLRCPHVHLFAFFNLSLQRHQSICSPLATSLSSSMQHSNAKPCDNNHMHRHRSMLAIFSICPTPHNIASSKPRLVDCGDRQQPTNNRLPPSLSAVAAEAFAATFAPVVAVRCCKFSCRCRPIFCLCFYFCCRPLQLLL